MNKILITSLLLGSLLYAAEIPTSHAKVRAFGKKIELNSKVIQLSNAKQSIMSLVSGHIEEYFVQVGSQVKKGDKIALIESISLSKMTADYISLKRQFRSQNRNYKATKKLYNKGMISLQELNSQSIQKDALLAQINALKSQLNILGIDANSLKKASPNYILYAHSDGRVSELLQALHSSVNEDTPIISIIKNQAFYIKTFLPLKYASSVKVGQEISVKVDGKSIKTHITQILPELDEITQRIVVLSSVDETTDALFINAFVASTLYLDADKKYVAVEKSALSFFNNEWVVFIPKKDEHEKESKHESLDNDAHDDHTDHDEHKKEDTHDDHADHGDHDKKEEAHDEHENHDDHKKEDTHDDHANHDDHKKEDSHEDHSDHGSHEKKEDTQDDHADEGEKPYDIRIVEIVTSDDKYTAVLGLKAGEAYVSDKSYYVKSMMLKSSLGGHGH
jgi:RND family efflux transporter MFP subunit